MNFDLENKATDPVLLTHLHHLTRYAHVFDETDKGSCGVLFDLAVEQYNQKVQGTNLLVYTDDMLTNGSQFSAEECQHVSEGYTWVLLKVKSEDITCSVHVPLNLMNYERGDSEEHPLLNIHYLKEAIYNKDSKCVNEEGHEVMMLPRVEVYYQPEIFTSETVSNYPENEEKKTITYPVVQPYMDDGETRTMVHEHEVIVLPIVDAYFKEADPITHETEFKSFTPEISDLDNKIFNNQEDEGRKATGHLDEIIGLLGSDAVCSDEEVRRLLDLYAAMITQKKAPGLVLYMENVVECHVNHELDKGFKAIISVNDEDCYFGVSVENDGTELVFTQQNESGLERCEHMEI